MKVSKRAVITTFLGIASITIFAIIIRFLSREVTTTPPNIIVIIADDMSPNMLSIEGIADNPWIDNELEKEKYTTPIRTPILEKLAKEGVYFNKTYLTIPSCVPSRASLLTGMMPFTNGVDNNSSRFDIERNKTTLPRILKENGYKTYFIGKCHMGGQAYYEGASAEGSEIPDSEKPKAAISLYNFLQDLSFDEVVSLSPDNGWVWNWYKYTLSRNGNTEKVNVNKYKELSNLQARREAAYITNNLTNEAINVVKNSASDEPFFIWLAHIAPHAPHFGYEDEQAGFPNNLPPDIREKTDSLGEEGYTYSIQDLQTYPNESDDLSNKPNQLKNNYAHKVYTKYKDEIPERRRVAYEMVTNLDTQIGRILEALEETKQLDNTIIVFISDNGLSFGEHSLFLKGPVMYDELTRSPLIIKYPKRIQDKETSDWTTGTNDSLITSLDLAPTILELASITPPDQMQGSGLLNLLNNNATSPNKSILLEYEKWSGESYPIRAVVTEDGHKFIHYLSSKVHKKCIKALRYYEYCLNPAEYDGFDFELYNMYEDPFEMNNLLTRKRSENRIQTAFKKHFSEETVGEIKLNKHQNELIYIGEQIATLQELYKDPQRIHRSMFKIKFKKQVIVLVDTKEKSFVEVKYRERNCIDCTWTNHYDFEVSKQHNIKLNGLKKTQDYDISVFTYSPDFNGGRVDKVIEIP